MALVDLAFPQKKRRPEKTHFPDNLRVAQLDALADKRDGYVYKNRAYYESIARLVRFVVPEGKRVLEIGCGTGDLLSGVRPGHGVGVDLSPKMVYLATHKYPRLRFVCADAQTLTLQALKEEPFDYIVVADTVGYVDDVWALLRALRGLCAEHTRVFLSYYNFLWEPLLRLGSALSQRMPVDQTNWLSVPDLRNLLYLNHFEVVRQGAANLMPRQVPLFSDLANRYLLALPGMHHLALTQYFVARPRPLPQSTAYTCSVVVPCKNEEGNIAEIIRRVPPMGAGTELIFVDGQSVDGTVEAIEIEVAKKRRPDLRLRLIHQGDGRGKGDAVRKGFAEALGDVLFILDADLTVPPEDLPKFYLAIAEGICEFVNGSRLVYPMEGQAMRLLNMVGNRFFGWALSTILGQRLKDTLCGTKVFLRRDYQALQSTRAWLGELDPFGDFDLLFGAAKANLQIVEMPIRYKARRYGHTKIHRFADGAKLLRLCLLALRKFTN